jgi:cobalt/nickel transport system permease protein
MSKISDAAASMGKLDELARRDTWLCRIHPLSKLVVTMLYLVLTVSFPPRQLTGVMGMVLYPFVLFEAWGLSFKNALYRLRIVLPVVCLVGILNPFFDREPVLTIGAITLTSGVLSMLSLMLKGILTVLASYLLAATTTVEAICSALRMLHIPGIIITEFLLICRYITVLLKEADRMTQAYALRAPGQKGVAMKAWGPMVGQLLLRSMDRAKALYQSMRMRGFREDRPFFSPVKMTPSGLLYLAVCSALLIALRIFPVLELLGRFFI